MSRECNCLKHFSNIFLFERSNLIDFFPHGPSAGGTPTLAICNMTNGQLS